VNESQLQVVAIQTTSGKRIDELFSEICHAGTSDPAELRSLLAERHGLDAGQIDFLLNLAQQADAEAVDRDKQALKSAFGYRDYSRDVGWLLDDQERPFHAAMRLVGLSTYASASEFVLDCYYARGALEPIVRIKSQRPYRSHAGFDELLHHLEQAARHDLIERFWTSVVRRARSEFLALRLNPNARTQPFLVEQQKKMALEGYDYAIAWMTKLERPAAIQQLTGERDALRDERFNTLPPVTDTRRMDEAVFWELISQARSNAATTLEQVTTLDGLLRRFGAADLKRFGSFYVRYMRKLYHWHVWALAYAARGGCSDDAFQEFRSWLILQADPDLLELAIKDPARAARRVPADLELPDGGCLSMIEEAYLQRKGAPLELPSLDLERPKGREWPEAEVETLYPELFRHYAR
jgi:hypothetical protein